jgi:hypothetical protein
MSGAYAGRLCAAAVLPVGVAGFGATESGKVVMLCTCFLPQSCGGHMLAVCAAFSHDDETGCYDNVIMHCMMPVCKRESAVCRTVLCAV